MNKKVCFVGHRNIYDYERIKASLCVLVEQKIKEGCKFFTMGTHGDFDKMALSVCRNLRKIYNDIKIEVVITSLTTLTPIVVFDKKLGCDIYSPYEDIDTIMYEIEEVHYKRKIIVSNQKMIDNCDVLICYVNNVIKASGAKLALNYAKKNGLKIINIHP